MTQLQQLPSAGIVQQWCTQQAGIVQQWFTEKKDDQGPQRHPHRNPPPNHDPPPPRPPSQPVEVPDPPRPVIRPDQRQARMPDQPPLEVPFGGANDGIRLPRTTDVPVPQHYRNPDHQQGRA